GSSFGQAAGKPDKEKLGRKIEVPDELPQPYPPPGYASLPLLKKTLQTNSTRFWQASLWFVMGERPKAAEVLAVLARNNRRFGLESTAAGHVFIYRVVDLPREMTVSSDPNGGSNVGINDSEVLKR